MGKRTRRSNPQAGSIMETPKAGEPIILQSTLPNLYIGIVGTLVLQEGSNFRVAPFAKEFISELGKRFNLVFLTRLSTVAALEVARLLDAKFSIAPWRKGLGKVSGIEFGRPFLWIDHTPSPRDLMRLAEERCSAQLITVNGRDGVTRGTLTKVEACLAELELVGN